MKLKYPTRLSADMEDLQKLKNKLRRKRKLFNRMDALINNCLIKPLFKGNKLEKLSFQEVADLSSKMLHLYTKIRNQKELVLQAKIVSLQEQLEAHVDQAGENHVNRDSSGFLSIRH